MPSAMDLRGRSSVVRFSHQISALRLFKPLLACIVFTLTLASGFGVTAAQGASAIGAISGSAGATPNGAATYTIPINVPPGTKGMQPTLALSYNSQSSDGTAGYGWALSGFSAISRCPSSIDDEGQTIAVHLSGPATTSDTFCQDGQRLLYKSGSTYGVDGGTYDTPLEGYSNIVSHVDSGATNGPSWFTVQANDGKLYEYGHTTDSKIYALGTTVVRVWALDKVTDLNGNYYTIGYHNNDTTTGDYWPVSIAYTGNANAGVAPLHTVTFSWVPRSDNTVQANYLWGSLVTQTQLLSGITIGYNGATTFTYTLNYQVDSANFRNQLASVTECDASGDCLAPTTIQWQNGGAGWSQDVSTGATVSDAAHAVAAHLMDVDGDGIQDLVYPDTTTNDWMVMFGLPGGGFTSPYDTGDPLWAGQNYYQFALTLDYNGDGRMDLMVPVPSGWQVLVATGNRGNGQGVIFKTPPNNLPNLGGNNSVTGLPIYEGNVWAVDFFGRGLDDLVYNDGTNVYLVQNGSSTATAIYSLSHTTWKKSTSYNFIDTPLQFDGTGRAGALTYFVNTPTCLTDGCTPPPPTTGYQALQGTGSYSSPKFTGSGQISLTGAVPEPIDAAGGGLTDLIASNGNYNVELGTGVGFVNVTTGVADAQVVDDVVADYYGDGRQEAVVYDPNPSTGFGLIRVNYSLASQGFVSVVTPVSTALMPNYVPGSLKVGNIEANGLDDLVYSTQNSSSSYTWHYRLHNGAGGDLVTSVTDGFGNVSQFQYAPLSAGGAVYAKGSNATYPIKDLQSSMQVVTSDTESSGNGTSYTLGYAYSGAQYDAQGRGFLGFGGRTITDSRYSTTETLAYKLAFPWTGMVTSDTVARSSDGLLLSQISNTGADQLNYTLPTATTAFPFFDTTTTTRYNIASGAQQAIATQIVQLNAADFDINGNVTDEKITTVDGATSNQYISETITSYAWPNISSYCLTLPQQATVKRTSPAGTLSRIVSTSSSDLDTAHCRVNSQIASSGQSGDGTLALTTAHQYDAFGNISETDVSGPGMATRTSLYSFQGGDGEFATSVTQVVSPTQSLTNQTSWNYNLGVKASDTDANGNVTNYVYDGFGRLSKVKRADGTKTQYTYAWCSQPTTGVVCPALGVYEITTTQIGSDGTSLTTGYSAYDSKGRVLEKGSVLLGGVMSLVDTTYDTAGNALTVTRPYLQGQSGTIYKTTYKYATAQRRLMEIDEPANAGDTASSTDVTTFSYGVVPGTGYGTTSSHTVGGVTHNATKYVDALDEIVQTIDPNNGVTSYTFDAFGDVLTTTNADNKRTTVTYDGLGHKIAMVDPDMGTWTYQLDALGEVLCQTDADNQSIIQTYDGIGRLTGKLATAPGGGCGATASTPGTTNSTWTYDQAGALGLPATVSDSNGFLKTYGYDGLDRPSSVTTTVAGTQYTVSTGYDNFSRVQTMTYPVSVNPTINSAPTAVAVATPTSPVVGSSVTLDGSGSTDPNNQQLQYQWTQTAGTNLSLGALNTASKTTTFVPSVPGVYSFQLEVIDSDSTLSAPTSVSVAVQPAQPGVPAGSSPNYTGSVSLNWGNANGGTTYQVYESSNGTTFSLLKTVNAQSGNTSSATVSALPDGTYYFRVSACGNGVCGAQSASSTAITVLLPPAAPTGLGVSPSTSVNGSFTLSWTAPATTTQYRVFQSTNGGASYTWVDTFNNSSSGTITRTESGLADGTYTYTVAAWNAAGQGPSSSAASGTVLHVPGTPGAASVNPSTVAPVSSFTLSWGRASGTVGYYQVNGNTATQYSSSTLSVNLTSGPKDGTHNYYVQACNASGCSGDSASATLTISGSAGGGCPPPPQQCQLVLSDDLAVQPDPAPVERVPELEGPAPMISQELIRASQLQPLMPPSVTSVLAGERLALVAGQPLQPSEGTLQAMAARRAREQQVALVPPAPDADIAAWNHAQAARLQLDPKAPNYEPPAYIAYRGARIAAATGTPYQFAVRYSYDPSSGVLESVSDASTGFIYWRIASGGGTAPVDAYGHLLGYVDGNNVSTVESYDQATAGVTGISTGVGQSSSIQQLVYTWDGFGNLKQRCDINRGLVENLSYDSLNRLKTSNVSSGLSPGSCTGGNAGASIAVGYDGVGNIQTLSNSGNPAVGGTYAYDPNHPDAVSTVSNSTGADSYDANGNMVCRFGTWDGTHCNGGTQVGWNSDNLPIQITGPNGSSGFSYAPDEQRYLQTATDASGNTTTTVYIGNLFEVVTSGASTQYRHQIMANGSTVAVHSIDQSGNVSTDYLHSDHLGSVDAITDSTGAIATDGAGHQEVMSFDAFGLRRDASDWAYDLTTVQVAALKDVTDRGYTYQEQLDNVGLIHMNGRVYDPSVGVFISADAVMGGQRYAYAGNNPLAHTDPSGHCIVCISTFTNPVSILTGIPMPTNVAQDVEHAISKGLSIASHPSEFFADTNPIVGTQVNEFMARSSVAREIGGAAAMIVSCWFGPEVYAGYEAYITDLEGGTPLQDAEAGVAGYMEAATVDNFVEDGFGTADGSGLDFSSPDWGAMGQDLANQAENYADRRLATHLAQHYGINLTKFDEYLTVFSLIGTAIVGPRYSDNFEGTGEPGVTGYLSQGGGMDSWQAWAGLPVDVADTILGYQGLPDGTGYYLMYESDVGNIDLDDIQGTHSLGTITYRTLSNFGLTGGADMYALPFGLTGPVDSSVTLEYGDGVSGFSGNFLFNWGAIGCSGWEHTYSSFQNGTTSSGAKCAP